jgi:DNA-directed RNA polymerase subunit N (RpoN/RPB10)
MKVNCLSCGHTLDLRDAYDDYEGQVKCFICGALLAIHTQEGQVKSVELPRSPRPAPAPVLEESCSR